VIDLELNRDDLQILVNLVAGSPRPPGRQLRAWGEVKKEIVRELLLRRPIEGGWITNAEVAHWLHGTNPGNAGHHLIALEWLNIIVRDGGGPTWTRIELDWSRWRVEWKCAKHAIPGRIAEARIGRATPAYAAFLARPKGARMCPQSARFIGARIGIEDLTNSRAPEAREFGTPGEGHRAPQGARDLTQIRARLERAARPSQVLNGSPATESDQPDLIVDPVRFQAARHAIISLGRPDSRGRCFLNPKGPQADRLRLVLAAVEPERFAELLAELPKGQELVPDLLELLEVAALYPAYRPPAPEASLQAAEPVPRYHQAAEIVEDLERDDHAVLAGVAGARSMLRAPAGVGGHNGAHEGSPHD